MKKLLVLMLILALVLSTVGCGSEDEPEVNDDVDTSADASDEVIDPLDPAYGEIELRFSWWGGDSRHDATKAAIELFEADYPHITVIAEEAAWSGHQETIATQLSAGNEADIMQINYNWYTKFATDDGRFYDLNDLSDYIELGNWDQSNLDALTINGSLQGVPASVGSRIFFLNETLYAEAGADIPTTWDELLEAGLKFQENDSNTYALGNIPYTADLSLIMFMYLTQETGKPVITEDDEFGFTEEELIAGFEFVDSLFENGVIPRPEFDSAEKKEDNANWVNGNYAGMFTWDSAIQKNIDTLNDDINDAVVPVAYFTHGDSDVHSGVYIKPTMGFAISKNSEHPEAAAAFLNYLYTDEEAVKELGLSRSVPANNVARAILEADGQLDDSVQAEGYELVQSYGDNTYALHPYYEDDLVREAYEDVMEEFAYEGRLTPEEAAQMILDDFPMAMTRAKQD